MMRLVFQGLVLMLLSGAVGAQVPATAPVLKKSIQVDVFDNRASGEGAGDAQIAERLADQLSDALIRADAFVVVERARSQMESMQPVDPYATSEPSLAGNPTLSATRPAQAISAQLLIRGTVTDFGLQAAGGSNGLNVAGMRVGRRSSVAQVGLIVRVIDALTQQVLASHQVEGKVKSKGTQLGLDIDGYNYEGERFKQTPIGQAGQIAIDEAVRFIASAMSKLPYAAQVIKVDNQGAAIISCGAVNGLVPGTRFTVMSIGAALRAPQSEELLGFEQSELGTVTVARVFDRFAYTSGLAGIKAGDIVLLR